MKIINPVQVVLFLMILTFQSFAQGPSEVPLRDIFFDEGEFVLREDAKPVLKENAEMLILNPDINVEIVGYCNRNEHAENANLGQRSAEAVKIFLVGHGVESVRMSLESECGGDHIRVQADSELSELTLRLDSRVHLKAIPLSPSALL